MSDVTRILSAIERDDVGAAEQLLPLVYDELRKLAAAKAGPGETGPDVSGDGVDA
jgi:ECF sigma factor